MSKSSEALQSLADLDHLLRTDRFDLEHHHGNIHPDVDIIRRARVARNESTSPDVLAQLADDDAAYVRLKLAHNPSLPPEILSQLAADAAVEVRNRVAGDSSSSPEALTQLAADAAVDVRNRVAGNKSTRKALASNSSMAWPSYLRSRCGGWWVAAFCRLGAAPHVWGSRTHEWPGYRKRPRPYLHVHEQHGDPDQHVKRAF